MHQSRPLLAVLLVVFALTGARLFARKHGRAARCTARCASGLVRLPGPLCCNSRGRVPYCSTLLRAPHATTPEPTLTPSRPIPPSPCRAPRPPRAAPGASAACTNAITGYSGAFGKRIASRSDRFINATTQWQSKGPITKVVAYYNSTSKCIQGIRTFYGVCSRPAAGNVPVPAPCGMPACSA